MVSRGWFGAKAYALRAYPKVLGGELGELDLGGRGRGGGHHAKLLLQGLLLPAVAWTGFAWLIK